MKHIFTEKTIYLTESSQSLDKYFKETSIISKNIRANKSMIESSYSQEQYGGIFYDKSRQMVGVYVCDDAIMDELKEQGIFCVKAEYSLVTLYQTLRQLWEKRLELGINYIDVNECYNCLDIYAADKTLVEEYLEMQNITCGQVIQKMVLHPGNLENAMDLGISNADEPLCTYSIFQSETGRTDGDIKEGLKKLKKEYPNYECRNLILRIAGGVGYERYMNFDEELLDFVESLPEYQPNEQNPVEEMLFGDPERIELKSLLREYKLIYSEKNYNEIYKEYLSDWENYQEESREMKLYRLAVNRATGELSVVKDILRNGEENQTSGVTDTRKLESNQAVPEESKSGIKGEQISQATPYYVIAVGTVLMLGIGVFVKHK